MHGPTLPVPVFVSLHFVEAGVLANGHIHAFRLYHRAANAAKPETGMVSGPSWGNFPKKLNSPVHSRAVRVFDVQLEVGRGGAAAAVGKGSLDFRHRPETF